jgi:arabinofuranosyltransferase
LDPEPSARPTPKWIEKLPWVLVAMLTLLVLKNAWICDDAMISLRSVDNWLEGFGLRWNVAERAQVFTHALWVFVLAPFVAVTGEAFFTTMLVSTLITTGTAVLLVRKVASTRPRAALAVGALALSQSFVDYSTSGLENPLLNLLLVFFLIAVQPDDDNHRRSGLVVLLWSGIALTRPDAVLLVTPALAWSLWRTRKRLVTRAAIGFSPLIAWTLFALFYFGSPFPNTALAKLGTGISRGPLVSQGLWYALDTLVHDPLTAVTIATGITIGFVHRGGPWRSLAAGLVLFVFWVVWIGGDFMGGRFFAGPFVLSVALVAAAPGVSEPARRRRVWALAAAGVVALGLSSPRSPLLTGLNHGLDPETTAMWHGITDERARFYPTSSLMWALSARSFAPTHEWVEAGRELEELASGRVITSQNVGFLGYFAGPEVHIVDTLALTDPLLARLPVATGLGWRIGHYQREVPRGYVDSLESGKNRILNPELAPLYDDVVLATQAGLIAPGRLGALWRLNSGGWRSVLEVQRRSLVDVTEGEIALETGRPDEAAQSFSAAAEIDPYRSTIWLGLSRAHFLRRDRGGALSAIRRALELEPDHLEARIHEVMVLAASGTDAYRPVLDREPRLIEVHLTVAARLMERRSWASAEAVLREALAPQLEVGRFRQLPNSTAARHYRRALHATVHGNLASVYDALGEEGAAARSREQRRRLSVAEAP